MKIAVKKLSENAVLPKRATPFAAGADLYATEEVTLMPGETTLIHTGIAMEIPEGYGGFIFARSGLATKKGLAPANKVGVVDSDYRGEIMVALFNHSSETRTVENGERVAQMVILPYLAAEYFETDTLSDTDRGDKGFGSSGSK